MHKEEIAWVVESNVNGYARRTVQSVITALKKLMAQLYLIVTQRVAYKVTTKRKHSDAVDDKLPNQNFNPIAPNQIWVSDVMALMGYCNLERLHITSGDLASANYKQSSLTKVS